MGKISSSLQMKENRDKYAILPGTIFYWNGHRYATSSIEASFHSIMK